MPRTTRAKWASFTGAPGTQLPSLFKLAMDAGWVNGATREARAFAEVTGQTVEEANRKAPELGCHPRNGTGGYAVPDQ